MILIALQIILITCGTAAWLASWAALFFFGKQMLSAWDPVTRCLGIMMIAFSVGMAFLPAFAYMSEPR